MRCPALQPFLEAGDDARPGWEYGDDMREDVSGFAIGFRFAD